MTLKTRTIIRRTKTKVSPKVSLKNIILLYLFIISLATSPNTQALSNKERDTELARSTEKLINNGQQEIISPVDSAKHQYMLYSLLMAEMAAQRQMPEVALANLLKLARITQDPRLAKEATEWAIEYQAAEEALLAAELWAKTAPNDLQAQMVAATLVIGQSIQRAVPYLSRAIDLEPKEIGQHITAIQGRLSERSAEHLKMALIRIAANKPDNAFANLAAAQSAAQREDIKNANRYVDIALNIIPNFTQALELKARLIRYEDNTDTRALLFLKERVAKFANNPELRLFYASALLDANQYQDAVYHLKQLTEDKVYGGQALLFLGEIYRKQGNFKYSFDSWKKALDHDEAKDNAQYLLGELSELQGNTTDAVNWYLQIDTGPFHIPAQLRAAEIYKIKKEFDKAISILRDSTPTTAEDQKRLFLSEIDILMFSKKLADAMTLTEEILQKIPTDEDMLLAHSLIAFKLKKWDVAEKDLKMILQQNPNNTEALNTLGYILSQQEARRSEAKQYLEQALTISPNNPAYLDSMGWLHFRLGDPKAAYTYLKKASELSQDPEIAAHFAEVLWTLGKKEEAKAILARAFKKTPDNEALKETMNRLKIDLKPIKMVNHQ